MTYHPAWTTKLFTVGTGINESTFHPLFRQRQFELGHRADNLEHETPGRRTEIEIISETDERHAIRVEIGEGIDEMFQRPAEAINLPTGDDVKAAAVSVGHQAVQCWTGVLRAGHAFIDIFTSDHPSSAGGVLPQVRQLHLRVLPVER